MSALTQIRLRVRKGLAGPEQYVEFAWVAIAATMCSVTTTVPPRTTTTTTAALNCFDKAAADDFSTGDFSGGFGLLNWASDWYEYDLQQPSSASSFEAGNIYVENGTLIIQNHGNRETPDVFPFIARTLNTQGAISAHLQFEVLEGCIRCVRIDLC